MNVRNFTLWTTSFFLLTTVVPHILWAPNFFNESKHVENKFLIKVAGEKSCCPQREIADTEFPQFHIAIAVLKIEFFRFRGYFIYLFLMVKIKISGQNANIYCKKLVKLHFNFFINRT